MGLWPVWSPWAMCRKPHALFNAQTLSSGNYLYFWTRAPHAHYALGSLSHALALCLVHSRSGMVVGSLSFLSSVPPGTGLSLSFLSPHSGPSECWEASLQAHREGISRLPWPTGPLQVTAPQSHTQAWDAHGVPKPYTLPDMGRTLSRCRSACHFLSRAASVLGARGVSRRFRKEEFLIVTFLCPWGCLWGHVWTVLGQGFIPKAASCSQANGNLAATPLDCCRAPVIRDYAWHVCGWQVLDEHRDHVDRIGCHLANCVCVRVRMHTLLDLPWNENTVQTLVAAYILLICSATISSAFSS